MHYYKQPWQYKLTLLKYLCEWQLETNDVFRQAILETQQQQHQQATNTTTNNKDTTATPPTTTPSHILGEDEHGNRYYIYMVGDNTARAHLYLEPFHSTDRRLDSYRKGGAASSVTPKEDKAADKKQENGQKSTSRSRKPAKSTSPTAASKKTKQRSTAVEDSADSASDADNDTKPLMNGKSHAPKFDPPTTPPGFQLLASTWQELTDLTQIWHAEYASSTKFQQMVQRLQTEVLPDLERQEKAGRRKQRQVGSRRELAELTAFAYEPRSTRTRRPVSYAEDALAPELDDEYQGPRGRTTRQRRNYNEDNDDDEYNYQEPEDDEPSQADEELAKALANPYSTRRKRAAQVEYGDVQEDEEEEQQAEEEESSDNDEGTNSNVASTTQAQPSTDNEAEMSIPSTPTSTAAPPPTNDIPMNTSDSRPLGSLHQYMKQMNANAHDTDNGANMLVDQPPTG